MANMFIIMSVMPASTSCCSSIVVMYFWYATPSVSRAIFLAFATMLVLLATPAGAARTERRTRRAPRPQLLHRFHQRQLAALGPLQQHAGGEQTVDLVGAFENAVDARVAIGALDGVVLMVAVAAVDLHAFVDDVSRAPPTRTP